MHFVQKNDTALNIALLGGGTGSYTLLQELKHVTPDVSALVNMSDDGGSSGILRDELDVLPPGDTRQCLVALSNLPEAEQLFNHRFGEGSLAGHSLGNLILAGLEIEYADFNRAVKLASYFLQITGKVVPITLEKHTLVMQDGDETVRGEHLIGHRAINSPDAFVRLEPAALINCEAAEAIEKANMLVIAPGNLYGSLLPVLAVTGMRECFQSSKARKVVVSNLVTKTGQTDGWHVVDYVHALEQYIGDGQIDTVLYNNRPPSEEAMSAYSLEAETPVATDIKRFKEIRAKAVEAPLVASEVSTQNVNDATKKRTLIRHDAKETAKQLVKIYTQ